MSFSWTPGAAVWCSSSSRRLRSSLAAACMPRDSQLRSAQSLKQSVIDKLNGDGLVAGCSAMVIRIFKEDQRARGVEADRGRPLTSSSRPTMICDWSGELGPKIKEGDRQAPEGFYTVNAGLMNPNSNCVSQLQHRLSRTSSTAPGGRTGSDLMVHGDCSSRGCYSMTDEDDRRGLRDRARDASTRGNPSFQLQIFPFRMTPQNHGALFDQCQFPVLAESSRKATTASRSPRSPPNWDVCEKKYVFDLKSRRTASALDAAAACPARLQRSAAGRSSPRRQASELTRVYIAEVAAIGNREADEAETVRAAEADAKAAAKDRGDAIGGFVGGSVRRRQQGRGTVQAVVDPAPRVAPWPAPTRTNRAPASTRSR